VTEGSIQRPRTRTEETEDQEGNPIPTRVRHLMSDESGEFPVDPLNEWELGVLDLTKESMRKEIEGAIDAKSLYLGKAATDY